MILRTPPPGRSFRLALLSTFMAFAALYAPQPLLPFFAEEFQVSPSRAALLITVSLMALAVAPLGIGVWLQRYSAQRLLVISTALLGLLQIAFAEATSFSWLLAARVGQSLLFPAIFTAAVTYCSRQGEREAMAGRISLYVASTIVGGMSGRLIGGYVSGWTHWTTTFHLLGVLLILCSISLFFAARDTSFPEKDKGAGWMSALGILGSKVFLSGYLVLFLMFFCFVGLLNALPFRMVEVDPDISTSRISLVYLGYAIGVVIAVFIKPLTRLIGGEIRTLALAIVLFLTGLSLYGISNISLMIAIGFITSSGMFTVHATLSGFLNSLRPDMASLVNGLYISIYYTAGALGSWLPVLLYNQHGWSVFLGTMLFICSLSLLPLAILHRCLRTTLQ